MSAMTLYDEPAASAGDAERRIAPRTRVLKRAKVIFNNNSSTFDCLVRNYSATGALLTLDENVHLPKEFDLRIGEDRTPRLARLVYRRGPLAGVHFIDGSIDVPPPVMAGKPEGQNRSAGIRRLDPERLPDALLRNLPWN